MDQETKRRGDPNNWNESGTTTVPDMTLVICAGDFLAPSLLSSLDQGAAMVDCLNACGVTHVCLGNHETDVSLQALRDRMQQSRFAWINTNMRELDTVLNSIASSPSSSPHSQQSSSAVEQTTTCEYSVVPVATTTTATTGDGHCITNTAAKHVALLGLLTHDPGLYRPGAFGGAPIEPVVESAVSILEKLQQQQQQHAESSPPFKIDLIIPLTHQSLSEDRVFAERFGGDVFPVICGGHDHEVYDETVNKSRIIKVGMDAVNAAIIDIKWDVVSTTSSGTSSSSKPKISVEIVPTSNYAPDADMLKRVQGHQVVLRELECAHLFLIDDWMNKYRSRNSTTKNDANDEDDDAMTILPPPPVFSTVNNRLGPSTGTEALCTMLRMGMRAQCAIVNAGGIRGGRVYDTNISNNDKGISTARKNSRN